MYVADAKNNRVQQFLLGNPTGQTVAGQSNGAVGSGASYLNYSNDMAVDSNGNIYVADSYNNRAQLWYVNSSSGITIAGNGECTFFLKTKFKFFLTHSYCWKFIE